MCGSLLYDQLYQGVRLALGFNAPPQSLGLDRIDDSPLMAGATTFTRSARFLTVDMTVDALMGEQKARFYAGFRSSEMIEWE